MSYCLEDSVELTDLADAVRAKTGSNSDMSVADMATAISGITVGEGNLYRRQYVEVNVGNRVINYDGGELDIDLGLPSGTKFLFIFTTNKPDNVSTSSVSFCYIFYFDGNNLITLSPGGSISRTGRIESDTNTWNLSFSLAVDSNTNTRHFTITNNETTNGRNMDLYYGGYNVVGTGRVWGNLFYISPSEIGDPEIELPII